MSGSFDFIAIGDSTTDAFIRIKDARVNCSLDEKNCQISLNFGDKVPYEFVEIIPGVGNGPNAATAAARLGLTTALVSDLGDDDAGKEILQKFKSENINTTFVKTHQGVKTNYHYVLWYEDDRTILVKHEEYPYQLPDIGSPKWIYLSSLGASALLYQEKIAEYLNTRPDIKLAFQPGTFQIKSHKKLEAFYKRADIFFCNISEAQTILGITEKSPGKLLSGIKNLGPKIVIITDGPRGAYVYDGNEMWFMPPYPDPKPPYERTGAGDAFASTVTAALAIGKNLEEALRWGPVNSMSVVQYVGAQKGLLSKEEILSYLANAPHDYKLQKII